MLPLLCINVALRGNVVPTLSPLALLDGMYRLPLSPSNPKWPFIACSAHCYGPDDYSHQRRLQL